MDKLHILGKTLYTQEELIKEINDSVNPPAPLKPQMLAYYRDIAGMIPKPIRIRKTKARGGATSYYTPEAMASLKLIVYENKINEKTLRDILKEKYEILDDNKIKSDIFRAKYGFLIKTKNKLGYDNYIIIEHKNPSSSKASKDAARAQMRAYLRDVLKRTVTAIDSGEDDEKLDGLLDQVQTLYYKHVRHRMEEKAKEEKK
jgi:hypothetical protein